MTRPATYAITAATLLLLAGCGTHGAQEAKAEPKAKRNPMEVTAPASLRQQLKIGELHWAEVAPLLRVAGRVEADATRLARVGTPVTGRLTDLLVLEGEQVKRGQVLATLRSTELSDAQFAFVRAYSQRQQAERAVNRAKQLVSADVIGTAELQRREAELLQANAELASLQQQLKALGVSDEAIQQLETTRRLNSEYPVVASISGTVLERKATVGQILQPAEVAFLLADLSSVWLVADIPEQSAGHLRVGRTVDAEVPALPDVKIHGRLSFVSATVDPDTRTVRTHMMLPNPRGLFKPAMLATISVRGDQVKRQLIPATAVVREENQDYVFVQTGDDKFVLRPVTLGAEFDDQRVITDGVNTGEKIVLDGSFHLNNQRKQAALQGGA